MEAVSARSSHDTQSRRPTKAKHGLGLYKDMLKTGVFTPVIRTMIREGTAADAQEAQDIINAFLQWMSLVPVSDRRKAYVMLKTDVDHAFHAFVLNTEFYQAFCNAHFGFFVHHNPLDDALSDKVKARGGVEYTLDFLEKEFGDDLHPRLKEWRVKVAAGVYSVSSVSCVQCDD